MKGRRISVETRRKIERKQKDQFAQYLTDVSSGGRHAGLSERLKVERHVDDMARTDWEWVFDWESAHKALTWMQLNLRFPSGTAKGKALAFEPWEVFDIASIFGWVSKDDPSVRRFTTVYWQIARKNGKSTLGGAVCDYMAFGDDCKDARVYIAASSFDQMGESFVAAADCLREGYFGEHVLVSDAINNKKIKLGTSFIKGISSNPKDGKLPHGLLLDEYHQHSTKELYNSIDSGRVADPRALMMIITTSGPEINGVCHQEYEKCKQILAGVERSDRYWIGIYEPDEGDADDNPATWEKANPNLGVSVHLSTLQDRYDKCRLSEDDLVDFRIKNLNRWVSGTTRWANMEIWIQKCCTPFDDDTLLGRTAYGALDLSSTSDFTAFTMTFPNAGGPCPQKHMFWVPEDKVPALIRQLRVPIRQWIADGYMTATPGPIVDYETVGDYIKKCMADYDLRLIGCDDWRLEFFTSKVGDWFENLAVVYGQGMKSMFLPVDRYKEAYLTGQVTSGGNPVITWMMGCVESKTINGNTKLVKPQIDKSKTRIDGVITSVMSHDLMLTNEAAPPVEIADAFMFF